MSEKIGFSDALINTDFGPRKVDTVRNNQRVIHDSPDLAKSIWEDAFDIAPKKVGNSIAIGLNERFRFYK